MVEHCDVLQMMLEWGMWCSARYCWRIKHNEKM